MSKIARQTLSSYTFFRRDFPSNNLTENTLLPLQFLQLFWRHVFDPFFPLLAHRYLRDHNIIPMKEVIATGKFIESQWMRFLKFC